MNQNIPYFTYYDRQFRADIWVKYQLDNPQSQPGTYSLKPISFGHVRSAIFAKHLNKNMRALAFLVQEGANMFSPDFHRMVDENMQVMRMEAFAETRFAESVYLREFDELVDALPADEELPEPDDEESMQRFVQICAFDTMFIKE